MVESIHMHFIGLAAGLDDGLVLGLADLDPHAGRAGEILEPDIGLIGVRQAGAKRQRAIPAAQALQLVRLQRKGHQADHHALVGLARMAGQRERMVGVVGVVDVGDLQGRLEDGGFQGHSGALRQLGGLTGVA